MNFDFDFDFDFEYSVSRKTISNLSNTPVAQHRGKQGFF